MVTGKKHSDEKVIAKATIIKMETWRNTSTSGTSTKATIIQHNEQL